MALSWKSPTIIVDIVPKYITRIMKKSLPLPIIWLIVIRMFEKEAMTSTKKISLAQVANTTNNIR